MNLRRRRLGIMLLALTWVLTLVLTAIMIRAWERWKLVRLARAYEYAGELLSNPSEDLQIKVLEPLGIPPMFASPQDAAITVLLIADAMDDGGSTEVDHLLGFFLVERNCDAAKYFFRKHLSKVGSDEVVESALNLLEREGCEGVLKKRGLEPTGASWSPFGITQGK